MRAHLGVDDALVPHELVVRDSTSAPLVREPRPRRATR
jgi:hypothetical protein